MSMQSLKSIIHPLLPKFFFERYFFDLLLWQWLVLFAAAIFAFFLSYLAADLSVYFGRRILAGSIRNVDKKMLRRTFMPLRVIFLIAIVAMVVPNLELDQVPLDILRMTLRLAAVLAFTWLSFRIYDVALASYSQQLLEKGRGNVLPTLPLFRRAGKILILVIAALATLRSFRNDITAIITGFGFFGAAVALAAQKTIQNLFSGITLILDQPIRVGQECKFGNFQGVVEDIGLYTTRIRTSDRSVVAVPNGEFSQLPIENLSKRDRIRLLTTFGLRVETTPDQMRAVLIAIREILYAHPKVDRDPARVRFINLSQQSLDIEISAYVLTSVNNEFLAVKEDILLRVMDAVHDNGTSFAIPIQVMYQHEHEFFDEKRTQRAEKRVSEMREKNLMPLPEFSDEQILSLDDTIDYPPKGSANPDPGGRYS